ncbi:hypothetical protein A2876_02980 [Candidatus Amesbacteria bacterium RIFCSPHIGHO2_01_FULL_48_32b]|uniref:Uncharacterized protein n=1 Tax=Candidatus Amesbacteria bacterium RIFCSPHIGHO2_01_FULL_48_32b TaxID=1797253 RepID=A0A1F4YFH3_9BACT|nr:MAG: hypothetical protein A2876_02980 [Candidatus Amesbacteria bacterium RIFCSPHIGHO2_01_FULL_48_32b]
MSSAADTPKAPAGTGEGLKLTWFTVADPTTVTFDCKDPAAPPTTKFRGEGVVTAPIVQYGVGVGVGVLVAVGVGVLVGVGVGQVGY